MLNKIELYFHDLEEPDRGCLLALREVVLNFHPDISESWKWNMPFYDYKGKYLCYFGSAKKGKLPYLAFTQGKHFEHSLLRFEGRKQIKSIEIDPNQDLSIGLIHELLELAVGYYDENNNV